MLAACAGCDARPHGFRATFRSSAEECTDASFEMKGTCLGHVVDKGGVGGYKRNERLSQRELLLAKWAEHLKVKCVCAKRADVTANMVAEAARVAV